MALAMGSAENEHTIIRLRQQKGRLREFPLVGVVLSLADSRLNFMPTQSSAAHQPRSTHAARTCAAVGFNGF
jgi:hypothetical protein